MIRPSNQVTRGQYPVPGEADLLSVIGRPLFTVAIVTDLATEALCESAAELGTGDLEPLPAVAVGERGRSDLS